LKLRINIVPEAQVQIDELSAWWDANRPAAVQLADELERLFALLLFRPHIGLLLDGSPITGVRTRRIGSTPYMLYYWPETAKGVVHVLAVWTTAFGTVPPLSRP